MRGAAPVLAITPGEPAGIGPDLVVRGTIPPPGTRLVIVADPRLLEQRARQLDLSWRVPEYPTPAPVSVLPVPLARGVIAGSPNPENANYVLECLERATRGCLQGEFQALVTGPVQKSTINEAGIAFSGHTEFLAGLTGGQRPVMLLAAGSLRVALATTHLPLREVAGHIDRQLLSEVIEILYHDLVARFALSRPRILVLGLNPHAGEDGHLGREEIEVLQPVLAEARARGWDLVGPLPADTAFTPAALEGADAVLAMYHDQGLPVLKALSFGRAVNVTLGLPIIRTSVDHGTALSLAGGGNIDDGSFRAALTLAAELAAGNDLAGDGDGAPA
ncbi:MAG: 4-hydroxythreonine-4-phosphate dehydrogenase PdxA [Gammaproteobacteria bacterium]|nr:4-hydroxythreonine-4-phosphate dehydrogenase PdxA [Gammaproteobacteria bacterium]